MKKSSEKYSLVLIAAFLLLAALCAAGCKGNHEINHKDSTLCAVYEGWPLVHDTDFETEPVFIPLEDTSLIHTGQTLWIDSNGFIARPMMRDAETKQFVEPYLMQVVIHDRFYPNRYQLIK